MLVPKLSLGTSNSAYHLDGPACIRTMLDVLLEIEGIETKQFAPGARPPPTYTQPTIPRCRNILDRGRGLHLLAEPDEVEPILAGLPPEGLLLRTFVDIEEAADELLKKATRWWARGRGSSRGHSLRQHHRPIRVHPGRHRRPPLPARSLFRLQDCPDPAEDRCKCRENVVYLTYYSPCRSRKTALCAGASTITGSLQRDPQRVTMRKSAAQDAVNPPVLYVELG